MKQSEAQTHNDYNHTGNSGPALREAARTQADDGHHIEHLCRLPLVAF